jgi:hypothetical protein
MLSKINLMKTSPYKKLARSFGVLWITILTVLSMSRALAVPVDVELSLVIDVSGSVDATEYALMMDGYAAAFNDPTIQANILAGAEGAIAVNVVFFASDFFPTSLETWRLLDSVADISDFANDLDTFPRPGSGGTNIASGINRSTFLFDSNGFESSTLIMDVSGDGTSSVSPTDAARDAAATAGITVNGLPIENGVSTTITDYYTAHVITPGAFIETATIFATFEDAVKRKLTRETDTGGDAPCDYELLEITCPDKAGDPFVVNLNITNNDANTAIYGWLTPCPGPDLPPGAITLQPEPTSVFILPIAIPAGETAPLSFDLPSASLTGGETVCVRLTLLDQTGGQCCTMKICVDIPVCPCAELVSSQINCQALTDGTIKYTITLNVRNRTDMTDAPHDFAHANFLPPVGFAPASVDIDPDIAPGAIGTITTCYFGAPGELCFGLALHNAALDKCCSLEDICLTLPDCGHPCAPDTCTITHRAPCVPSVGFAEIVYTVCNNCDVPRTYNWSADGIAAPGCDDILTPADFSQSSGTIGPVAPGDCASVTIRISCGNMQAGQCAGYQVCASYRTDVAPVCCNGVAYVPAAGALVMRQSPPADLPVIDQNPTPVEFRIHNTSSAPVTAALTFTDQYNVLGFSLGNSGTNEFFTQVALQPNQETTVTVNVFQLEQGNNIPDFSDIQVWAYLAGATRDDQPSLLIPAQLAVSQQFAAFQISDFNVSAIPSPRVIVRFPTVAGQTYQIQESPDLKKWEDAACTVVDVDVDAAGRFQGTGAEVTCIVPCNSIAPENFYRAVVID